MTALTFGIAGTATGAELQLSVSGDAEYDPNVGRNSEDVHSGVFRVVPKIHLMEDDGNLHYDVHYKPYYQYSTSSAGSDGFQHYLSASSSYFLGDQTEFYLSDDFSYADSVDTVNSVDATGTPTVGTRDEPVSRNSLRLGVRRMFTQRMVGNLSAGWRLFNADLFNRANSNSYTGNVNLRYVLSSLHTIGGGAAMNYQDFEESNGGLRPPRQTLFVNLFGSWTWAIDETTSFEFTVGPTYIDSKQDVTNTRTQDVFALVRSGGGGFGFDADTCPLGPGGRELGSACLSVPLSEGEFDAADAAGTTTVDVFDPFGSGRETSWTVFGSATLNKRWRPDLVTSLSYNRRASTSSGLGSAVLDDLGLINTWEISELWSSAFRVDFTKRTSTSPVQQVVPIVTNQRVDSPFTGTACTPATPGDPTCIASFDGNTFQTALIDQDIDTIRWGASTRVTRRFTKRLEASLRYTYAKQTSKSSTLGASSDFDDHLVTLGVQYNFDRWNLW